ncbi:hypothetical protein FRC16_004695 [Serendipita sp. 398]|nr:hypothetical protein FRC16_004695 [Serendipita sp. 398]
MVSRPTITVTLCKIGVPVNDTVTERIKIYRIAFAFRNLASTRRSLYVDLPVRWRTNQVSQVIRGALLLEIYQWISNLPRKNSLIIRRVRSMHQEMCTLVDGLSDAQLDMQFTPNSQPGAERTFNVPLGVVVIRVHSATQVMFRIKTNNGCHYEELFARHPQVPAQQLRNHIRGRYSA